MVPRVFYFSDRAQYARFVHRVLFIRKFYDIIKTTVKRYFPRRIKESDNG